MIYAEFFTDSGLTVGFSIRGHSDSGSAGNDIVCAAVSSAAYLTANTITDVIGVNAAVSVKDGFMELKIPRENAEVCSSALQGFRLHMAALQKQYLKYLHVYNTEV